MKLILMLLCLLMVLPVDADNIVLINDIRIHPGSNITAPIVIINSTGISGGGIKLNYSPNIVNITNSEKGDFTDFFAFDNSNALNGEITINTFKITSNLIGNLTFANITFQAKTIGSSPLNMKVICLANKFGDEVQRTVKNGTFVVSEYICGDTTGDDIVNIGDALRLANNISYPGNIKYILSSTYAADVTGNDIIDIGDAIRIANNISYPKDSRYILRCMQ